MVAPKFALWGLLHDASEAYLVDLPTPLKRAEGFEAYRNAESRMMRAVAQRFGLPWPAPFAVKAVDEKMLATEARDLLPPRSDWYGLPSAYPFVIEPQAPDVAEAAFIERFNECLIFQLESRSQPSGGLSTRPLMTLCGCG